MITTHQVELMLMLLRSYEFNLEIIMEEVYSSGMFYFCPSSE